jgi:hypothetical protein
LLEDFVDEDGNLYADLEDEVVRGAIVLDEGKMMWPPPLPPAPPEPGVPTKSDPGCGSARRGPRGHDG